MKQILILSGKGGTGKTTVAAAFMRFSQTKAAADCDVDAPNLHLVSGRKDACAVSDFYGGDKAVIDLNKCTGCGKCLVNCRFNAIEIRNGVCRVNEFACEGCGVCGYVCPEKAVSLIQDTAGYKKLYLKDGVFSTATLKMGRGNSGKLVTEVKTALVQNAREADIAVVDGSPGIGCPVIASASGADLILVVAEPSQSGISDLKRLIKTAESFQTTLCVCVNKWDVSAECTREIEEFLKEKNIFFAGRIPYDPAASEAVNAGRSIADSDCPARDALREIYDKIIHLINQ